MELYFAGGGGHFLPGGAFLSLLQSLGPNDALLTEINRRGGACACAAAACSPGEGTWHPWPGLFGSTVQGLGPGPDSETFASNFVHSKFKRADCRSIPSLITYENLNQCQSANGQKRLVTSLRTGMHNAFDVLPH